MSASLPEGRYDSAARRQGVRVAGYRGIRVYIPAAELIKTGFRLDEPPPFYRVWGAPRGRVVVQLYREG